MVVSERRARGVLHGLDVVAVRVKHERSVVAVGILRTRSGRAVVATACCDCRGMKRIDLIWRLSSESHMDRRAGRIGERDHKVIKVLGSERDVGNVASLAELRKPQRYKRRLVERSTALETRDPDRYVIDDNARVGRLIPTPEAPSRNSAAIAAFPARSVTSAGSATRLRRNPIASFAA